MSIPVSEQVELLLSHLRRRAVSDAGDSVLDNILEWIRDVPPAMRTEELLKLVREKFQLSPEILVARLEKKSKIPDIEKLIPDSGWIRDYVEFTRETEPPTVFHLFVGLSILGATMQRNVYVQKGHYAVFPNLCIVLVAPSGKCRKTSACNIGVDLLRGTGGQVIADKTTPEALVEAFKERETAAGLLYAPELAVFLGKQKYQEGMIPMLTSLFDAPKEWNSMTIGRGELKLTNVALSFLGASTLDWIQSGIPKDAHGGGFMSRLLFVIQEDTPRSFPIPPDPDTKLKGRLVRGLMDLTKQRGAAKLTPEALTWYTDWYNNKRGSGHSEKHFAGYIERKPDHLFRVALNLAASTGNPLNLELRHFKQALALLDWLELWMPETFEAMSSTGTGEMHAKLLKQIRNHGGKISHSAWLRLNSSKLDSRAFREHVSTMVQSGEIEFDSKARVYLLTPDGWK